MGSILLQEGKFKEALDYYQLDLGINISTYGPNHPTLATSYSNIGLTLQNKGDYLKALQYLEMGLAIREKNNIDKTKLATTYNHIGIVLDDLGQPEKALSYFNKALRSSLFYNDEQVIETASIYNNIGVVQLKKKNYKAALESFNKASQIYMVLIGGDNNLKLADVYSNIGVVKKDLGQFEEAIDYYNKALNIYNENLEKPIKQVGRLFGNIGIAYKEKGEYYDGIRAQYRAIEILRETVNEESPELSLPFLNIGKVFLDMEQPKKAIPYLKKGMALLNFEDIDGNLTHVKHLGYLKKILNALEEYYQQRKSLFLGNNYQDSLSLLYSIMIGVEDELIKTENSGFGGQKYFKSDFIETYEKALGHSIKLNTSQVEPSVFLFFEKTKCRFLIERLKTISYDNTLGLKDSLHKKEHNLNIDIGYYEKKKYQEQYENQSPNDSLINIYSDQIFMLKRERDELLDLFRTNYKDYYNLRYSQEVVSVVGVQDSLLEEGQALLEYFVGDSSIFTFLITKDTFKIKQLPKTFPLKQHVQTLRESIYQPFHTQDITDAQRDSLDQLYRESAYLLYEKLIQPVEDMIQVNGELIIVPDGVLGYIPFDALLTDSVEAGTKVRDYPYLLKKYQTSIAYSATLLKEMQDKQHKRQPAKPFLGVAPSFDGSEDSLFYASRFIDYSNKRNRLSKLEENIPEVKTLQSLIGGDTLINTLATKSAFLAKASDYRILHLATHGKANDQAGDYSFLAFYQTPDSTANDWLYNRELYNMQLNADMVVLSACETGIGELQRGEGIISLARGFSYAGAKSIITSLWTVNDKEAPVLMEGFYKYLKEGYSKDAALRQAKLDYLESSPRPAPYYWASFIPIGDMQPLEVQAGMPWCSWVLIIAGLMAAGLWWRYRKNFG